MYNVIVVNKEELKKQIADEFIESIPNNSNKITIICTEEEDNFNANVQIGLMKDKSEANFYTFLHTLKVAQYIAEKLIEKDEVGAVKSEIYERYIEMIDEDLKNFEIDK